MSYPQETYPKTYKHIERLLSHSINEVCIHDNKVLNMLWKEDSKDGINWDSFIESIELSGDEDIFQRSLFGDGKNQVLCGAVMLQAVRKNLCTIVDHIIEDIKHG